MDELIAFLRCKTNLGRFTEPEIRDLIARMDEGGWEIVRKGDGVIVEPEWSPSAFNDEARKWMAQQPTPVTERIAEFVAVAEDKFNAHIEGGDFEQGEK